jgi:murein DD-endopeptidase MepM/ murein hydrolase activator NlpD
VLGLLVTLALAAELELQPGVAQPGDVVLVSVFGADEAPKGALGDHPLRFFAGASGGFHALVGLSIEAKAGVRTVDVALRERGRTARLEGALEVLPAAFPRRQLSVDPRFTHPSKREQERSRQDQAAFDTAFDAEWATPWFAGNFAWPRPFEVTAPFGDQRMFNGQKKSQHFGVDLEGRTGDEIRAANDGEVVMVRDCFGSGNTVLVHHGARLFTAYFHLSKFLVKQGQRVHRGELLGLVGKTGRVTGPHLHFGVKLEGRWVNGVSLLALDFTAPSPAGPAERSEPAPSPDAGSAVAPLR